MSLLALSRTCRLADFSSCPSPACWQQHLVNDAYQRWWPIPDSDLHAVHYLLNLSGVRFVPTPEVAFALHTFNTVAAFLREDPPEALASVVALMVLDRIEAPLSFLKHVARDLLPGGLLVATVAYWDAEGTDIATGHEVRLRIYNRASWQKLLSMAEQCGLRPFGGIDWTYKGHALGDHTLASVVLTKGERR